MSQVATVDEAERIRATRVEVSRLLALPFRERLTPDEWTRRNQLLFQHVRTLPKADQETFEEEFVNYHKDMDWSILGEPGVKRVVDLAVRVTMANFPDKPSATRDDLTQSAAIILAERHVVARQKLALGPNLLRSWLADRLGNLVRREHHVGERVGYARASTEEERVEDYAGYDPSERVNLINQTGWVDQAGRSE